MLRKIFIFLLISVTETLENNFLSYQCGIQQDKFLICTGKLASYRTSFALLLQILRMEALILSFTATKTAVLFLFLFTSKHSDLNKNKLVEVLGVGRGISKIV